MKYLLLLHVTATVVLLSLISTVHATKYADDCRQSGFDPDQLACSTCNLLPSEHQPRCQDCCAAYKVTDRMTKPYEAAVLATVARSSQEYMDFIEQDWDDLVKEKGSNRLSMVQRQDPYAFYPVLFFFDKPVAAGISLREYASMAKETVDLDGWKRDDIRDMLKSLLP